MSSHICHFYETPICYQIESLCVYLYVEICIYIYILKREYVSRFYLLCANLFLALNIHLCIHTACLCACYHAIHYAIIYNKYFLCIIFIIIVMLFVHACFFIVCVEYLWYVARRKECYRLLLRVSEANEVPSSSHLWVASLTFREI